MKGVDKTEIAALANQFLPLLDGTTEPIKKIIAEHDIVYGVWADPAESEGIGTHLIKGQRRLAALASSIDDAPHGTLRFGRDAVPMTIAAIPCECAEQAVAAQLTFGEAD